MTFHKSSRTDYIKNWRQSQARDDVEAPKVLYKYRSLKGNGLEEVRMAIEERKVWFASPSGFNDVFDGKMNIRFKMGKREARKFLDRGLRHLGLSRRDRQARVRKAIRERQHENRELHDDMNSFMQEKVDSLAVYCLSEAPDDMLMWSYYADGHQGICLGFDHLRIAIRRRNRPLPALPITYTRRYPLQTIRTQQDTEDLILKAILTKSNAWLHEREWRIIDTERRHGLRQFPDGSLIQIVLGAAISEENQSKIREWAASLNPKPKLLKAAPSENEFAIAIKPLES